MRKLGSKIVFSGKSGVTLTLMELYFYTGTFVLIAQVRWRRTSRKQQRPGERGIHKGRRQKQNLFDLRLRNAKARDNLNNLNNART